jgi:hypothetical protein
MLSGAFDVAVRNASRGYAADGPGLARVRGAGAMLSDAIRGDDVLAYTLAVRNLDAAFKAGTMGAGNYRLGLDALNTLFADVVPLVGNVEAQAERVRAASLAFGNAGLESIGFYFGKIGEQVQSLAAAAEAASAPIAQATAAIGRLNSVSTVFGESAGAAFFGFSGGGDAGRAMLNDPTTQRSIVNAELVSTAAAIAAQAMTTADAARVAEQLSGQFAGTQRRDASMLLDGLSAYDAGAFETAFARLNNALDKGTITGDQYRELFDLSIKTYQGTETAASKLQDAFAELHKSAKSLADQLLVDAGLSPLSGAQRFGEAQRQFGETVDKARGGDLSAIANLDSATRTMLQAGKERAGTGKEYDLLSAGTVAILRDLEQAQPLVLNPTPLLSNRNGGPGFAEVVAELQAVKKELAELRTANSAENQAAVSNQSKTARILEAVTTGNLTFTTEAAA